MTPLNDVFMMPYDAVLNFDTVSEIMRQGEVGVVDRSSSTVQKPGTKSGSSIFAWEDVHRF